MECAMESKTSSRNSGGVINPTVAKSRVLEFPRYSDGSILSNLRSNTVPDRDWALTREKWTSRPERYAH